jgi:hypothetical protein
MKRHFSAMRARLAPGEAWAEAWAWLGTFCLVLTFAWEDSRPIPQLDDAFISYRYALNLVHGHGLVFNTGEYVEGITNLLWTLLIAAGIRLGFQAPAVSQALSIVFGAASLVVLHLYARRFVANRSAWMAAAAPAIMLASNSFIAWMSAGLETPLFLLTSLSALFEFDRRRPIGTALFCLLAFMCRPEGGILAALLLGGPCAGLALLDWRKAAAASMPLSIFAFGAISLTLFRLWYYGDWVPNTFHAKVGQTALAWGVIYLERFLSDGAALLLPGFAFGACLQPRLFWPSVAAVLTAAYVVSIGGDVFPNGRFLLPTLPVMLAGNFATLTWLMARNRQAGWAFAALAPATIVVCLYINLPLLVPNDTGPSAGPSVPFPYSAKRAAAKHHNFFPDDKAWVVALGDAIRRASPGAKLVACVGLGEMGYYNMDFRLLDMVGLIDRHIARSTRAIPQTFVLPGHSRTDSDYVLARQPDIIIMPDITAMRPGLIPAEADLLTNPNLPSQYAFNPNYGFWVRRHAPLSKSGDDQKG